MKKLTKEQALEKIEQLKKYVSEKEQEEPKGFVIKNWRNDSEIYVSKADNIKEAVIEAVENGANLSEANLRGADLSEADLYGADLYEADLYEADLSGADLGEADLGEANLRGADLSGAELGLAKFYGKGGTVKLKKDQVEHFLNALGFQVEG